MTVTCYLSGSCYKQNFMFIEDYGNNNKYVNEQITSPVRTLASTIGAHTTAREF
ncbi:hypothetical protein BPAE_0562g00030 [Botrytis paeoniae]|uniref:Uncharacterized protein n=1 Tax=Botrytis paeoniae TaxID=278948 RepID=A0A4Z1ESY0_9HELO|nr:hypothetical protein BPAE_0562g00030 [Botrytis paeoniae]